MTPQEIKEGNALIAEFLGYKYYKKVLIDFSDCGGIYDWTDVYSKVPIEVDDYPEEEQCYFKDNWCRDNYSNYIYNPAYHEDWNQLIPVLEKIENQKYQANRDYYFSMGSIIGGKYQCYIEKWGTGNRTPKYMHSSKGNTLIEAVYTAIVEFVQYYKTKNSEK